VPDQDLRLTRQLWEIMKANLLQGQCTLCCFSRSIIM